MELKKVTIFLCVLLITGNCLFGQAPSNKLSFKDEKSLQEFFKHTERNSPIISGHRGCSVDGYPENSLEAFAYVLEHTAAFFEIDPRLTKDSVIVLMHDATLDRTTTGSGKLIDYTWEEVKRLKLKDRNGNITAFRVPSLAEAIEWARGKTVLNLDKKDVPMEMISKFIREHHASSFVMVTVHTAEQAKFYYDRNPMQMMSAFVKTEAAFNDYSKLGIPWSNMIAYIGSENKVENAKMFNLLHAKGVKCMISSAPSYDKLKDREERAKAYRETFLQGADILESDFPVEVSNAIFPGKKIPK